MRVMASIDMQLYDDGSGLNAGDIVDVVTTNRTRTKKEKAIKTGECMTDIHHFDSDIFDRIFNVVSATYDECL